MGDPALAPSGEPRLRADAERNLRRVLDAAREAFAAEGFEVPVSEIARRAGVGPATVFRRFPTKRDLMIAVAVDGVREMRRAAEDALAEPDPWTGLVRFLEEAARRMTESRCLKEATFAFQDEPELRDAREDVIALAGRVLERAQRAGQARGDVRHTDLPFLLSGVAAASHGGTDLWRRYLGLMLDGLRAGGTSQLVPAAPTREELDAAMRVDDARIPAGQRRRAAPGG